MRKIISIVLSFGLLFQQSGLVYAVGELNLANYLSQARSAIVQPDQFRPPQLRYISYDIKSNDFKLLLDKGGAKLNELPNSLNSSTPKLNDATQELFNYFLIGLSLPNDTFWVNLRPDAPDNIIDPLLEKTDIGKIFLEADLQLKKDTASFTSPQNPEGKAYWDKLYKKAGELFGTENITIPTITRPWIVPNEVIVRETEDSAYIYKATLKVMLESDYLIGRGGSRTAPTPDQYAFSDPRLKELNEYSSQLIRETIIPKLTKEINSSKRYAQLRQVYYSLVLSRWFKQKYQGLPVGNGFKPFPTLDSEDLTNLTSQEPCDKQAYFQAYQKSFKDGEYNLKETMATPFGQNIRSYISGGLGMGFEYKAVNSPVTGIRVNSSPVTNILTEQQPPATTASPVGATAKSLLRVGIPEKERFDSQIIMRMKPIFIEASREFADLFSDYYKNDPEIKKQLDKGGNSVSTGYFYYSRVVGDYCYGFIPNEKLDKNIMRTIGDIYNTYNFCWVNIWDGKKYHPHFYNLLLNLQKAVIDTFNDRLETLSKSKDLEELIFRKYLNKGNKVNDGRITFKKSIDELEIGKALNRFLEFRERDLLDEITELTKLYEIFASTIDNSPEVITALLNKLELARLRWSASNNDEYDYVFRIRKILNHRTKSKLYMENGEFLFSLAEIMNTWYENYPKLTMEEIKGEFFDAITVLHEVAEEVKKGTERGKKGKVMLTHSPQYWKEIEGLEKLITLTAPSDHLTPESIKTILQAITVVGKKEGILKDYASASPVTIEEQKVRSFFESLPANYPQGKEEKPSWDEKLSLLENIEKVKKYLAVGIGIYSKLAQSFLNNANRLMLDEIDELLESGAPPESKGAREYFSFIDGRNQFQEYWNNAFDLEHKIRRGKKLSTASPLDINKAIVDFRSDFESSLIELAELKVDPNQPREAKEALSEYYTAVDGILKIIEKDIKSEYPLKLVLGMNISSLNETYRGFINRTKKMFESVPPPIFNFKSNLGRLLETFNSAYTAALPLTPQEIIRLAKKEIDDTNMIFQHYRIIHMLSLGDRIEDADPFSQGDVIKKLNNEIRALQKLIEESKKYGSRIPAVVSSDALGISIFFKELIKGSKNSSNQSAETRNNKVEKSGSPLTLDDVVRDIKRSREELIGFYPDNEAGLSAASIDELIVAAKKAGEQEQKINALELNDEAKKWHELAEELSGLKAYIEENMPKYKEELVSFFSKIRGHPYIKLKEDDYAYYSGSYTLEIKGTQDVNVIVKAAEHANWLRDTFLREEAEVYNAYTENKEGGGDLGLSVRRQSDLIVTFPTTASPITAKQFEIIVQHIFASSDSFEVKAASIVEYWLTLKSGEEEKSIYAGNIIEIFGKFINLGGFRGGDATINYIMEFIESKLRANKEYLSDQWSNEVFASVIFHSKSKEDNKQIEISTKLQEALNAKSIKEAEAIIEKLIKEYPGSEEAFSHNRHKDILAEIRPIAGLLSLFMKYDEQQEILENTVEAVIKDAHASIVGTDKIRLDGLRDPEKVGIGVERILKKIFKAVQEAKSQNIPPEIISDEFLKLAKEVFIITSQKDKTYRYRELIGAYIIGVFEEFLKNKSGGVNVKDMQIEIEAAFSGYIRENVISFLITFIRNNINNPYGKFIGEGQVLNRLIGELKEKAQEEVLGQAHYDAGKLLSIIKELRELSEDTRLETAEENLSLIQKVTTAASPLTLDESKKFFENNVEAIVKVKEYDFLKQEEYPFRLQYVKKSSELKELVEKFVVDSEKAFRKEEKAQVKKGIEERIKSLKDLAASLNLNILAEELNGIYEHIAISGELKSLVARSENDAIDKQSIVTINKDITYSVSCIKDDSFYTLSLKKIANANKRVDIEIGIDFANPRWGTKALNDLSIVQVKQLSLGIKKIFGMPSLIFTEQLSALWKSFDMYGIETYLKANHYGISEIVDDIDKIPREYYQRENEISTLNELKYLTDRIIGQFDVIGNRYPKFQHIIIAKTMGLRDYRASIEAQLLSEVSSSSAVMVAQKITTPQQVGQFGGIDLTDRMLQIKLERVGSFASSALVLPEIANVEVLDLDKEFEQIQAMVSSSIRPSDTRILEFAAACYYRGEFDQRLAQVSSCIKVAHLADEISGRDSSEALRLATMLPDALYGG